MDYRHMKHIFLLCLLYMLFGSGCASTPKQVLHCYPGAELPNSSVSEIEMGYANYLIVDGMYYAEGVEHSSVRLLPGEHKLNWSTTFGVSVLVDARMRVGMSVDEKVNLEAGHTYRIFADRTTGHGYRTYTWIEDVGTGKVVAGMKMP
jgi:hypothetical protein